MRYSKKKLLSIARKVAQGQRINPDELSLLLSFEKIEKEKAFVSLLKKSAVPIALTVGFLIAVFPSNTDSIVKNLPQWTNLTEQMIAGADYFWNILSEPVGKANIIYHLPNIILYSFGVLGVKKLFDAIDRRSWIDRVNGGKKRLTEFVLRGATPLLLKKGHSVLFMGKGDFIGMQFVLNHTKSTVVIGEIKPSVTDIWNYYSPDSGYDDLKTVLERSCGKETGEYMFFPVKDDQVFLPSPTAYDLSPHKLDILCQDIRMIEKNNKWKAKRILIVGDKFHKSFVQSEDKKGKIKNSEDLISLESISSKYPNVTLVDPTDIVLSHILEIAKGRKIVFRATKEGIIEYKKRFYDRLELLGYNDKNLKKGILTIGYDLFEDQTEQQTLAKKVDDYYPVVLSKGVKDALVRNGHGKNDFIYVPDLVLQTLTKKADEQ